MERKSCIRHGNKEVIVVFEEDGELRNHVLRNAQDLAARYATLETDARERRQMFAADADAAVLEDDDEVRARRQAFETDVSVQHEAIDADAFARAEQEIADDLAAAAAAKAREEEIANG